MCIRVIHTQPIAWKPCVVYSIYMNTQEHKASQEEHIHVIKYLGEDNHRCTECSTFFSNSAKKTLLKEKKAIQYSDSKKLHISIGKSLYKKLQEMSEYYSTTIPETIRASINFYYGKNYHKEVAGTSGVNTQNRKSMKEQEREAYTDLLNMTPTEQTAKLLEIGYLIEPALFNDSTGSWMREVIIELPNGERTLRTEYYIPETGKVTGFSDSHTLPQIINEIKKKKLL